MMAHGKRQRLRFARRESGQTDYRRRLKLLRGGAPRAVVRVTNTQVICQIVNYEVDGDRVVTSVDGSSLVSDYKWPKGASKKSVPACYLAGLALAKRAASAGVKEAVLDIGLAAATSGNRAFAALRGMVEGGLDIPHDDSVFPDDERIAGAHISDSMSKSVDKSKKAIEGA